MLHAPFARPPPISNGSIVGTLAAVLGTQGDQVSNISYLFVLPEHLEPSDHEERSFRTSLRAPSRTLFVFIVLGWLSATV